MAIPLSLRRFDITVYRNKNGTTDTAQVPAASTVRFYLQGATIKTGFANLTSPRTLSVWHAGAIAPGDTLWVNGNSAQPLTVDTSGVDSSDPSNVTVKVTYSGALTVSTGDRLILAAPDPSRRPQAYSDPLGVSAIGTSVSTTEAGGGRANCYIKELRFDYTVSITGDTGNPRVFPDAEGSFVMR
jgi:hypothetical protein